MELQPRDLQILEFVGELGTADTVMIHERFFPDDHSGRACQQRLKKLSDEGLLTRNRTMTTDGQLQAGSHPMLYFVTPEGGDLVAGETGLEPRRVARSQPKPFTLRHRLYAVRVRLAIDEAANRAGLPQVEWVMEQDTDPARPHLRSRSPSDCLILNEHFDSGNRTVTFRPDAACHLQIPTLSGNALKSLLAYFEIDLSTIGHLQWQRKLCGMEAFLAAKDRWRRHWPQVSDPAVVLLVPCLTLKRVQGLSLLIKESPIAGSVRFAVLPLTSSDALTGTIWYDADGRTKSIIKSR